jgi:hypothetical protein
MCREKERRRRVTRKRFGWTRKLNRALIEPE